MIINVLELVFSIIGTIGFVLWYNNEKKQRRKEKLKSIIIKGINYFTSYKNLYEFLFKYHRKDLEKLKKEKEIYLVDYYYYFGKIFKNKVKFLKDKTLYQFPLIYKKNWLKSNNNNFWVELETLDYSCENDLLTIVSKFLKRFGISDFVDFLKIECNKNVWKQITFDLYRIEQNNNGKLIIFCCKSNYLNFVNTYELIQKELYYIKKKNLF